MEKQKRKSMQATHLANHIEKADDLYRTQHSSSRRIVAVRKRPGCICRSCFGLHHLVWEIVDNPITAFSRFCDEIVVSYRETVSVTDNGRGMPVDVVEKTGKA